MKSSVSAMCRRCWLGFRLVFGLVTIVAALGCTVSSDATAPTGISCPDCPLVPVDQVIDGGSVAKNLTSLAKGLCGLGLRSVRQPVQTGC